MKKNRVGILIIGILFLLVSFSFASSDWTSIMPNGIPYQYPNGVYLDKEDNAWVTGAANNNGSIYYFANSEESVWYGYNNTEGNLPKNIEVMHFFEDSKGNQWFSTWNGGAICLDKDGKYHTFDKDSHYFWDFSDTQYVYKVREALDGGYWMVTLGGAYKISENLEAEEDCITYTDRTVYDFIEDKDGNRWISTSGGVLTNKAGKGYYENLEAIFSSNNIPPSDGSVEIREIFKDSSDNLWFISNNYGGGGIFCYKIDGTWDKFDDSIEGIPTKKITSIAENLVTNDIWFGTNYKGLIKYDGSSFVNFSKEDLNIDSGNIATICFASDGTMWLANGGEGGAGAGIQKIDLNTMEITTYTDKNTSGTLVSTRIWDIAVDNNNGVWFGSNGDGLSYMDENGVWKQFYSYNNDNTLGSLYVSGIEVDSNNVAYFSCWNSSDYSYYDIDSNNWGTVSVPYEASSAYDLFIDENDNKWYAQGNGCVYLSADNLTHKLYSYENTNGALPSDIVNSVFKDSRGNVWMATRSGIGRLNEDDTWTTFLPNYEDEKAYSLTEAKRVCESKDGYIYVYGGSGVQRYNYGDNSWTSMMPNEDVPYGAYPQLMPNGDIWFGTGILRTNGTLTKFDGDNTENVIPYNGEVYVKDIAYSSDGKVYFAFIDSGVAVYSGESFNAVDGDRPNDSEYILWDKIEQESFASDKVWTISFNQELDETTVNENNICIYKGNETNKILVNLEVLNNKQIKISFPAGYISGEYYHMYIKTGIKSKTGNVLKKGIKMTFYISE